MWIGEYRNLDKIIKEISENTYDNELTDIPYKRVFREE